MKDYSYYDGSGLVQPIYIVFAMLGAWPTNLIFPQVLDKAEGVEARVAS